jgi:hypothetical protein
MMFLVKISKNVILNIKCFNHTGKMNKTSIIRAVAILVVVTAAGLMIAIFATELTQITLAQKNTSISAIQPDSQNAVSNAATATNPKFLTYENSTLGIKI